MSFKSSSAASIRPSLCSHRLPQIGSYSPVDVHYHVLTDISGPMYSLVTEYVTANLGGWEQLRDALFDAPEFNAWFKQFQLFVEEGQREYFTLEGDGQDWSRPGVIVAREVYHVQKWQVHRAVELLQRYGALLVNRQVGQRPRILTDAGAAPCFAPSSKSKPPASHTGRDSGAGFACSQNFKCGSNKW